MVKKLKCNCKHSFQDKEHGKGIRVHNFAPKGNQGSPGWRCTVCKNVKAV
jgi:hypothetical protein